jgi:hypothetical protein
MKSPGRRKKDDYKLWVHIVCLVAFGKILKTDSTSERKNGHKNPTLRYGQKSKVPRYLIKKQEFRSASSFLEIFRSAQGLL